MHYNKHLCIALFLIACSLSFVYARNKKTNVNTQKPAIQKEYSSKKFTAPSFLSDKQFNDHYKLYTGYINKRNQIKEKLGIVNRSNQNITYSPFRGLKIAETFARNASLLHELYFENIKSDTTMGEKTKQLLIKNFSSIDAFKEDLFACASCARGWAITCYNLDDNAVQTYVLDAHNETVPILCIPLLVVDVYEHAYMIDFGIDRAQYLELLFNNINWDIVEERITRWVPAPSFESDCADNHHCED